MRCLVFVAAILISALLVACADATCFQHEQPRDHCVIDAADFPGGPPPLADTYDYIVVGAGAAGAAAAARISTYLNCHFKVLVLDAGPDVSGDAVPVQAPVGSVTGAATANPDVLWDYTSATLEEAGNTPRTYPRAAGKSGTTLIGDMVHARGTPYDFDRWANETLDQEWSYQHFRLCYNGLERSLQFANDTTYHGASGPIAVKTGAADVPADQAWIDAIVAAGVASGMSPVLDFNGNPENTSGVGPVSREVDEAGRRVLVSETILAAAMAQCGPLLEVQCDRQVVKLLMNGTRAIGVDYIAVGGSNTVFQAWAKRAVVLSAGAINSPQLLELAGIGQREVIEAKGIEVVKELPGVGENLQDHPMVSVVFNATLAQVPPSWENCTFALGNATVDPCWGEWESAGTGAYQAGVSVAGFHWFSGLDPTPNTDYPDCRATVIPRPNGQVQVQVQLNRAQSVGRTHILSTDPLAMPKLELPYGIATLDVQRHAQCVELARELASNLSALGAFDWGEEISPGATIVGSNLTAWIRANVIGYAAGGTTKMSSVNDRSGVVDPRLRPWGTQNLFVIDAGIQPHLADGEPAFTAVAIGIKGADRLLQLEGGGWVHPCNSFRSGPNGREWNVRDPVLLDANDQFCQSGYSVVSNWVLFAGVVFLLLFLVLWIVYMCLFYQLYGFVVRGRVARAKAR